MKDILNKLDKEEQIFIKQFYRFENGLPIIITTRFDKNGLISRFNYSNDLDLVDATISKLYQMCYGITLKNMKKELVKSDQT